MTVERKREAVVFLQTKEVSQRRSCQLIFLARSTCHYRINREPDQEFETEVKELAFAHPRYGYRRIHALLKRSGQVVNRRQSADGRMTSKPSKKTRASMKFAKS